MRGGGAVLGPYVGDLGTLRELCNKYKRLWKRKCAGLDLWCLKCRGKCGDFASSKARGDWGRVFTRMKRVAWENNKVCVKIHRLFFVCMKTDHPSNISMNRTVERLAVNSGEEKELFKRT